MNKILVFDIPARLFHWAFAVSLTAAIAIGFLMDDDQPLFQLHMIFGIVAMFLLVPALFLSGIGYGGEDIEELHELFAWALLAVIALHLAGLAWHTFRHRENISLAMVTGKKTGKPENAIAFAHPVWGVILLIGAGLWIAALFANHNSKAATVKLPGIGVTLQLGENASGPGENGEYDDD